MTIYVGIDVHRSFSQVAIIPDALMRDKSRGWEKEPQHRIENTREDFDKLISLLIDKPVSDYSIAIDHTGGHYSAPLVNLLVNAGYELCYIHPSGLRNFKKGKAQYNKTDRIDAAYMARALYYHKTHGDDYHFSLLSPKMGTEAELLRTIITQRQMLLKLKTQTANRLHQLLISTFPEGERTCFTQLINVLQEYPSVQKIIAEGEKLKISGVHKNKISQIQRLAVTTIGIASRPYDEAILYLAQQHKDIERKLKALDEKMDSCLNNHPYTNVLLSIPGMGRIAAATLIASIRDINYFDSYQKLRKVLGVAPKVTQSGNGAGKSHVGPGNKDAKRVLFQIVFSDLGPQVQDNDFRDYYVKKKTQGMHGTKAIVACMGQLVEVIYHCLKNGEFYEYQGGKNESI